MSTVNNPHPCAICAPSAIARVPVPQLRQFPWLFIAVLLSWTCVVDADPNVTGATGLVYMPSARIDEEGTFRIGFSNSDPYFTTWSSISMFPWLELSARYTRIDGVPGIPGSPEFGNFKDKAFDAKLRLLSESRFLPEISVGAQDFTGTQLFKSRFVVANKRIGSVVSSTSVRMRLASSL